MHPQSTPPSRASRERRRPGHLDDATVRPAPSEHAEPYGYVRVSTIMQRLKGYSIPKQLRQIAEAAISDGAPILEANLLGDADSGGWRGRREQRRRREPG